jgi:hypothetical protein
MTKWLCKASDDGLSHCACQAPLAALPGQLDCPWCGCGWMIACATCHKAFTFARVVEIDRSHEDLVRADLLDRGLPEVDAAEVRDGVAWLAETFADFEVGDTVVYLDGRYVRADPRPVAFEGLYAAHDHPGPPQVAAARAGRPLTEDLGRPQWWFDRERPDRD